MNNLKYVVIVLLLCLVGCTSTKPTVKTNTIQMQNNQVRGRLQEIQQSHSRELAAMEARYETIIQMIKNEKNARIEGLQSRLEKTIVDIEQEKEQEISDLLISQQQLEQQLKEELADFKAKLSLNDKGLVITFLSEILFNSGQAVIGKKGYYVLDSVAQVLAKHSPDHRVMIEGHTDNIPIKYSKWKTNWELSTQRALSVLYYFIKKHTLDPKRFAVAGYGEYEPVVSNATDEGRQQNRRVEIVILPDKMIKVLTPIKDDTVDEGVEIAGYVE